MVDEVQGKWITDRTIELPVIGGRDSGFRTFSKRSNLELGRWRVNVETESGQTIGRIRFNLVPPSSDANLQTTIK